MNPLELSYFHLIKSIKSIRFLLVHLMSSEITCQCTASTVTNSFGDDNYTQIKAELGVTQTSEVSPRSNMCNTECSNYFLMKSHFLFVKPTSTELINAGCDIFLIILWFPSFHSEIRCVFIAPYLIRYFVTKVNQKVLIWIQKASMVSRVVLCIWTCASEDTNRLLDSAFFPTSHGNEL